MEARGTSTISEVEQNSSVALSVAFVGTYPPRRCGIATFTRDLAAGMKAASGAGMRTTVVALTDAAGPYDYPAEVAYEIREGTKADYARAAEVVNYSDLRWASLQHEYGIFGGDDGAYVLDLLEDLRIPSIVTLHTVLENPSDSQRSIVQKMAKRAPLVVMSRVAADLLDRRYNVRDRVHIIPHGIPEMAPREQETLKARFGVAGQRMLLTFGLLGPNKGIETVIRALPAAVAACPDLVYFVVGATHPAVVRQHGEAYRSSLEREAEDLGVRDHVVFRDQYVTTDELCSYLQATDVFISPYLNEAQVTSGALSYAMGAGAAAVSTPYWHAKELLADGRGLLFPFGDSAALGQTLVGLLQTPAELHRVRAAAHEFTRAFTWPQVGAQYLKLGASISRDVSRRVRRADPPRASSLPELRLDHLRRLTDDTGIIQHATYSVPSRESGYCVDDNARALIVALRADRLSSTAETRRLVSTYLAYLLGSQTEDGSFRNFMSYARAFLPGAASEDCAGRALWALGTTVHLARDEGHRMLAREMFERGLHHARGLGPRGTALTMLGLASMVTADVGRQAATSMLEERSAYLLDRYRREATAGWHWFEPTLTYDNALLPLALFRAHAITKEPTALQVARESLAFLEEACFRDDRLVLVGNAGWHSREGVKADADEQPIDAAAFVLAFRSAYRVTGDHHYLRRLRQSFAWFLGVNRLGRPAYDSATAGCRDGLGASTPNFNQGAESTVCFLLALIEMLELAGEGLEYADAGADGAAPAKVLS